MYRLINTLSPAVIRNFPFNLLNSKNRSCIENKPGIQFDSQSE